MLEIRPGAQRTPRQSLEWCAYYAANAVAANVSWTSPVRLTDDERRAITASMQQFQLGESSEGSHPHAAARAYAARTGDDAYVSAIEAFIREEQRHARDLARFLTAEGIPLTKHSWPDAVFRWLRRGAGLEVTVSVLLTAEIIARRPRARRGHARGCCPAHAVRGHGAHRLERTPPRARARRLFLQTLLE
jgi:hypothetical protein